MNRRTRAQPVRFVEQWKSFLLSPKKSSFVFCDSSLAPLPFSAFRILARTTSRVASKMAFNGFPFGGFTMGATGPPGMDLSLDDMIKQVRLPFSAPVPRKDN